MSRSCWKAEKRIKGSYLSSIPSTRHGTISLVMHIRKTVASDSGLDNVLRTPKEHDQGEWEHSNSLLWIISGTDAKPGIWEPGRGCSVQCPVWDQISDCLSCPLLGFSCTPTLAGQTCWMDGMAKQQVNS